MSRAGATMTGGGTQARRRRVRVTPLRILIVLASLTGVTAGSLLWTAANWAPSRADYPMQGVALSAANGVIDWAKLSRGRVDFVWLVATRGSDGRDPAFAVNWAGAGGTGVRRGAIHAYSLCRLASIQARLFLATVPRDGAALPPVVALDVSPDCAARPGRDLVLSELNVFLNAVEAHSGKPAILRISPDFEATYHVSAGLNRALWLERPLFEPTYAAQDWMLWTANRWRRVDGIDGAVDWTVAKP